MVHRAIPIMGLMYIHVHVYTREYVLRTLCHSGGLVQLMGMVRKNMCARATDHHDKFYNCLAKYFIN